MVPCLSASILLSAGGWSLEAQQAGRSGLEIAGLPALNYDSDEGFGYGVIAELYDYGAEGRQPYEWTLQPTVFLTTGGRRDFTVFFDSPHMLPSGWRIDAFVGSEKQIATPYYGVGNDTPYDPEANTGPNPYFYRFGRTRRRAEANLQKRLAESSLRVLIGAGVARVSIETVPNGDGTTLLADELEAEGGSGTGGWSNHVRAGLVWDTRDRESGPRRGSWTELLVQRVDQSLGSETSYTRWTVADRRYLPLAPGIVFAHRVVVQGVQGDARFYDLNTVQASFKAQEGLGGAKTVRGVLKNRFTGKGLFVWNAELRWRAAEFTLLGRPFHTVLSAFVDSGRVWEDDVELGELLSDLHHGYGGGVRLGMGENFVVAVDVGTSTETGTPMYIGLGYLY